MKNKLSNKCVLFLSRTDKNNTCEAIGVYSTFAKGEEALKAFGATKDQVYQTIYGVFRRSDYNNSGYAYTSVLLHIDEISTMPYYKLNN